MAEPIPICDLPNLGPQSQAMLAKAGITTHEQISRLGAIKTFLAVKRAGCKPSLNLLWALEGMLSDRPWQEVAKHDRLTLLLQLERAENNEGR